MVEFAAKNSWAKYISVTYGLDEPTGFVKNEYTYDGLHPSTLGYAKISHILTKYIYEVEE